MARFRNREEVINTQLALVISKLGVTADAETIHVHGIHRPDVIFDLRGLRVVIEGKFSDNPAAEEVVVEDARRRVRAGLLTYSEIRGGASMIRLLAQSNERRCSFG